MSGSASTLAKPVRSSIAQPYAVSPYCCRATTCRTPCSTAACSVSPTLATWGLENTALGTTSWREAMRSSGCSRLCWITRASRFETCLSWKWLATSPSAQIPSTPVRWCSSTTTMSSSSTVTPARSRSRPSALERRPAATSTTSTSTVLPSERWARAPPSYLSTLATVVSSRTSQRRWAISVNAAEISWSSARSNADERFAIVTREPNDPKTWANSAATKPPPTMRTRSGSSSSRITVSLVW